VAGLHRSALAYSRVVEVVMARFKVELAQTVIENAIVFVEATDAQAAEGRRRRARICR
jgi:hypothetical protein